ncbi:MAG: DUF4293 domain-containing protein [Bacteroidota bacterium]
MIQRIQSIYLLLVVILNVLFLSIVPLWVDNSNEQVMLIDIPLAALAVGVSGLLALICIFLFKNRKLQFVINRINILINFLTVGFFVYTALNISGEMQVSEKGIGVFIPLVSIVFLVLANKAIKKDEDLVKSVDRFR